MPWFGKHPSLQPWDYPLPTHLGSCTVWHPCLMHVSQLLCFLLLSTISDSFSLRTDASRLLPRQRSSWGFALHLFLWPKAPFLLLCFSIFPFPFSFLSTIHKKHGLKLACVLLEYNLFWSGRLYVFPSWICHAWPTHRSSTSVSLIPYAYFFQTLSLYFNNLCLLITGKLQARKGCVFLISTRPNSGRCP